MLQPYHHVWERERSCQTDDKYVINKCIYFKIFVFFQFKYFAIKSLKAIYMFLIVVATSVLFWYTHL